MNENNFPKIGKTKISIFFDAIWVFISSLILFQMLFSRILNKSSRTFIVASFLLALSILLIFIRKCKRYINKQIIKQKDKELFEKIKKNLELLKTNELNILFKDLLKDSYDVKIKDKILYINDSTLVTYEFYNDIVSKQDIIDIYKKYNSQKINKITIFCFNFDNNSVHFAKNIKNITFEFIDIFKIFKLMKEKNIYPINKITDSPKQISHIKISFIKKEKAKKYALAGIVIYSISFIAKPYVIYYSIVASICFILCILCLFKKDNNNIVNTY